TVNGVAPAVTITRLLPTNLATPVISTGASVSLAHYIRLAVVYLAVAKQEH
ncbi:hypothetical protein K504DRAFT_385771, partial [Pleomassaria siparia CBS 279.74]